MNDQIDEDAALESGSADRVSDPDEAARAKKREQKRETESPLP